MSLGAGQSRPAPIGGEIHVAEEEKQITDWAAENQLDKVTKVCNTYVVVHCSAFACAIVVACDVMCDVTWCDVI